MDASSYVSFALVTATELVWVVLYGVGLWLAIRAWRENAPGAGRACAAFALLTVAGVAGFAVTAGSTLVLWADGVSAYSVSFARFQGIAGLCHLASLIAYGLLIAAFVSAWRAATDPGPDFGADPTDAAAVRP